MLLPLLVVSTPLIALAMSMPVWSFSLRIWGWISAGGAIVYAVASWRIHRLHEIRDFSYIHALICGMLVTISLYLLLDGDALLFANFRPDRAREISTALLGLWAWLGVQVITPLASMLAPDGGFTRP